MAFNLIQKKFTKTLEKVKNKSTLSPEKIDEFLEEIRFSLIESDVNIKVINGFLDSIKKKSEGQIVNFDKSSSQKLLQIVNDELVKILGKDPKAWKPSSRDIVMVVGIQGSGKTTTVAKLANFLVTKKKHYRKPLIIGLDVYRPAAIDQLEKLTKGLGFDFFSIKDTKNVSKILEEGLKISKENKNDLILLDTAGRLQTDEELMNELKKIKKISRPKEIIFISDAMSGQELINIADEFNKNIGLSSAIITKLDSNAKGGSSLSMAYQLNIPIRFMGLGEKINDLEEFIPKRIASRILGLGDIETLTEKVQEVSDEKANEKIFRKILTGNFDLNDLILSMEQLGKIGNMKGLAKFMPGNKMGNLNLDSADKKLFSYKILIGSMTQKEKVNPRLLKHPSRNRRILIGSGRTNQELNELLRQFEKSKKQMKEISKQLRQGKLPNLGDLNLGGLV